MAGRILPLALAVVAGVSIGVATFDGEFKEQRRKKLEEEYKQEVAAASSLNSAGPSPMVSSTIPSPSPEQLQAKEEIKASTSSASSWSSTFGLWAWNKGAEKEAAPTTGPAAPAKNNIEVRGKP